MVIVYHWVFDNTANAILPRKLEGLLSFGWSGVDLFFVLSGFLIGGILLDARDSANYFKVFYVRRFYRILPLYGALFLLSAAIFYVHFSTHAWLYNGEIPWYAYLTFGQNFWMAKAHTDFGAGNIAAITWSLAVEEQFYLTLPVVIWAASRKTLPYLLGLGIVLAPVIRIALWFALGPIAGLKATYLLAPCRMDALLLGVLAAWAIRSSVCRDWLTSHKAFIGTASAILGVGILEMIHKKLGMGTFGLASFGYTWVALFYLSILLLAVTQQGVVSRLFRFRALTELGLLAYGLYLFHELVIGLIFGLTGRAVPSFTSLATIGLTLLSGLLAFVLARLSWLYFEKPLVNRGHRYKYSMKQVYAKVAAPITEKQIDYSTSSVSENI